MHATTHTTHMHTTHATHTTYTPHTPYTHHTHHTHTMHTHTPHTHHKHHTHYTRMTTHAQHKRRKQNRCDCSLVERISQFLRPEVVRPPATVRLTFCWVQGFTIDPTSVTLSIESTIPSRQSIYTTRSRSNSKVHIAWYVCTQIRKLLNSY